VDSRARHTILGGASMADPMGLDVSNIRVSTALVANPRGGSAVKQYTVTYNIGGHGPFSDTYTAAEYSEAAVKAGIQKEVATLRGVAMAAQSGELHG
jgi:hypothetical protein